MAAAPPVRERRLPGPEWWERLAARLGRWRQRHRRLVERLTRVRMVVLWVALVAFVVVAVVAPSFRGGLRVWLVLYLLLAAWFLVTRTKSVSWRLVAGLFTVAVWWSVAIAIISLWLSSRAEPLFGADADGPGVVIAGFTEESLKLVPLALLVVLAPGRARRFAVVDWLLLGFASGLGFQAFEELARRTALAVTSPGILGILDRLLAEISGDDPPGFARYGFSLVAGGTTTELSGFGGHHVLSALVAGTVGLGVAAWRRSARLPGRQWRAWWRALAVAAPLAAWWLVVCDHAGHNASARTGSRAWVGDEGLPWLLRTTWDWSGRGFGRGGLLLLLLLLALLVDARRLRRGEARLAGGEPAAAPTLADHPGLVADGWAARLPGWPRREGAATAVARWWAALGRAACALAAYTLRDLLVTVGTHARQAGESRLAAIASGRLALAALRQDRTAALDAGVPADTTGRRWRARLLGMAALALLLLAGLVVAPALAEQTGTLPFGLPEPWLAGLFDALADWWDDLGPVGQIAVGLGIAGLIALSGGSLGLAFGISGAATFFLDKGHGLATFTRDPVAATRSYLETTTPQGMLLDLAEFGLTFAPGNFAGAAGGRFARLAVLRRVAPRANLGRMTVGRSVILADGTTLSRLTGPELEAFARWGDDVPWQRARGTGAARDYQVRIYGPEEPMVSPVGQRPQVWGDGLNRDYGAIGDAKFRGNASSFYDPESLHPSVQGFARQRIDNLLLGYRQVLDDSANPAQALELVTNDPRVAQVFAERMRALGVRGYVVLNP